MVPELHVTGVAAVLDACPAPIYSCGSFGPTHNMQRFAVLMYHRIESGHFPVDDPEERPWAVPQAEFVWQMDHLRQNGRIGVSMEQVHAALSSGKTIPSEWVCLTFDDGNASDHGHALPALAERGFRATFFVCGDRVDGQGGLTRPMIRELVAADMHVGSHAMTHRFLTTLSAAEEREEIEGSRRLLESIVERSVDHFAPPGGRWSARTARLLRSLSFRAVSTSAFGYNSCIRPRFAYRRIPVVAATSRQRFDDIISGARWRLWKSYARAAAGVALRTGLGEKAYARVRERAGTAS